MPKIKSFLKRSVTRWPKVKTFNWRTTLTWLSLRTYFKLKSLKTLKLTRFKNEGNWTSMTWIHMSSCQINSKKDQSLKTLKFRMIKKIKKTVQSKTKKIYHQTKLMGKLTDSKILLQMLERLLKKQSRLIKSPQISYRSQRPIKFVLISQAVEYRKHWKMELVFLILQMHQSRTRASRMCLKSRKYQSPWKPIPSTCRCCRTRKITAEETEPSNLLFQRLASPPRHSSSSGRKNN